jgi:hypothetical protein
MDATSGNDAAALLALAGELGEHIATLYSDDPDTADLERTHALTDAIAALDTMLGTIHPLRQRLVTLSVDRYHEAMRRTDELLARSRALLAEPLPTGGLTP